MQVAESRDVPDLRHRRRFIFRTLQLEHRFRCTAPVVLNINKVQSITGSDQKFTAFAGGIALALIMLPIVARATEEMLLLVPQITRGASSALGVPKWRTILTVILPAASSRVVTGVVLASARVAGKAAPLLFTALGSKFYSTDVFRPIDALPLRIYKYGIAPYPTNTIRPGQARSSSSWACWC